MLTDSAPSLRNLRTRYQRGLLAWLKEPESGHGLGDMRAALLSAALASEYGQATFWRAAEMVLDALSAGQLAPDPDIRQLVGRYDQQLRRCVAGEISLDTELTVATLNALSRLKPPPPPEPPPPLAPLASTLEATAAILPLVAKPKQSRFPPEQVEAWEMAAKRLALSWNARRSWGKVDLRPAVFALCAAAVDLQDPDALTLAEALASATDRLDDPAALEDVYLVAAISASVECLSGPDALDHEAFSDRVKHLAQRLEACARPGEYPLRSPTLDKLFFDEATEHIETMYGALDALPPDPEAMATAARALSRLAEPLELDTLVDMAYGFSEILSRRGDELDLEAEDTRQVVMDILGSLEEQVRQVEEGRDPEAPLLTDALLAVLEKQ